MLYIWPRVESNYSEICHFLEKKKKKRNIFRNRKLLRKWNNFGANASKLNTSSTYM